MKWISTEKRLPPKGERVLLTDGYFVGEGYITISNRYYRPGYLWPFDPPTHWMPLPESPIVVTEKENVHEN